MRIPDIADRLRELRDIHGIKELETLADMLRRRAPRSRAKPVSQTMTPQLAAAIRDYKRANPGLSQVRIGHHFNVNPGRVSEALRGKRQ